jgi:glycosyltransferase involved in cell wall biosynthesis
MKRAELCVRAMPHVLERHADARLAIIGYGPEEARLRDEIERLGLADSVFLVTRDALFLDRAAADRKVELMQQAWVHVLPSVKEGWGMVVTEAAACGTPSIVSDVTGLRDSVRDGETGLVVSANPSPAELAQAMTRLIDDDALRARLTRGALEQAAMNWDATYSRFRSELLRVAARAA